MQPDRWVHRFDQVDPHAGDLQIIRTLFDSLKGVGRIWLNRHTGRQAYRLYLWCAEAVSTGGPQVFRRD